jgi:hypothetical protein
VESRVGEGNVVIGKDSKEGEGDSDVRRSDGATEVHTRDDAEGTSGTAMPRGVDLEKGADIGAEGEVIRHGDGEKK